MRLLTNLFERALRRVMKSPLIKIGTLILIIIGICLPQLTHAEPQLNNVYYSLFADLDRRYTGYNDYEGDEALIEMFVYCYSSVRGVSGVNLRVYYPDNVITFPPTINTGIINYQVGNLQDGVRALYSECQWGIHWVYHQSLMVTDHEPGNIYLASYLAYNCEDGHLQEPAFVYWDMIVNYSEGEGSPSRNYRDVLIVFTPVETSSWSVIKSIMGH